MSDDVQSVLALLHPAVRAWFTASFTAPSPPQVLGWPAVATGQNVLLLAPTGSGKTLAAFLQCLSNLYKQAEAGGDPGGGPRVVYISPLKALNNDMHKNLEAPLAGIAAAAEQLGLKLPLIRAAVRTGDTPAAERRVMLRQPPHILLTTPESLFLMLSSKAREIFRRVEYLIVDEIHALFPNKRGVHLSVSLEHLAALAGRPIQRIGLSATQRPLDEIAAFLGGGEKDHEGNWHPRPVRIIDTGQRKELDLRLELPEGGLDGRSDHTVWPSIYRRILDLVRSHRSTLVFVNNRRLAERMTAALNDLSAGIARTHHGSLAKEKRIEVEELLKEGKLPCLVATSSLELGIDVGAIDLVVQVESPKEVARGLQRVGRAGHLVGLPSKGRIIPKSRSDLLECAVITREMRRGRVEKAHAPCNCLDVLAQQIVGLASGEERSADGLYDLVTRSYPYRDLARDSFQRVLDLLAGGLDEDRFLELAPRLYWDRINDTVRPSERGRRLVYTSGGTIPDRGYFGVYLLGRNTRLGELDEEFVFERRLGDRFVLGTSTWRIEEIRRDRVVVAPSGRGEAMVPFWRGETTGRPFELGGRFGAFLTETEPRLQGDDFIGWAAAECLMDCKAARCLRDYLAAQTEVTGCLPNDRRLVLEEFHDELGAWRLMLHSFFGARINGALSLLLKEIIKERDGLDVEIMHDDNGLMIHCPGSRRPPRLEPADLPIDDLTEKLAATVRSSTLFALRFRQNAARALLLPKAPYGAKRTPLWLSRLRASDLLQVVGDHPDFPVILETLRECLTEHYDLEGLRAVITGLRNGEIAWHHVRTPRPSPFTTALQFSFVGAYMYVPDLPKGEQRHLALGLGREALRELLGSADLRGLLAPEDIAAAAAEAGGVTGAQRPRTADQLHARLLAGGEIDPAGLEPVVEELLAELEQAGRVFLLSWPAAETKIEAWVAAENMPMYLAALPGACVLRSDGRRPEAPVIEEERAKRFLARGYAKTHGPFIAADLAAHYGWSEQEAAAQLAALAADGLVQSGEFTAGETKIEWCDLQLLRRIHRRSLARARREIEPRQPAEYASFLARWQGVGRPGRGPEDLAAALAGLAGLRLPASAWGRGILPLRIEDFSPEMLDRMVAAGRFIWTARGTGKDMQLTFLPVAEASAPFIADASVVSDRATAVCDVLRARGALFLPQIVQMTGLPADTVLAALEELTAGGMVTNDTLGPVRYFASRRPVRHGYHLTAGVLNDCGRWSLTPVMERPDPERAADDALRRYGLVTKDVIARDRMMGGDDDTAIPWDELRPVFDRWEAVGRIRRGYFVHGLAGIQFVLPEAVEMLRLPAAEGLPRYWAALKCDPVNPYGSLLPMPDTAIQAEYLVFQAGEPILAAGGGRMRLVSLAPPQEERLRGALQALIRLLPAGERIAVDRFDGAPILETPAAPILAELGFERGYKRMERWGGLYSSPK